jgi:hypothetical protein
MTHEGPQLGRQKSPTTLQTGWLLVLVLCRVILPGHAQSSPTDASNGRNENKQDQDKEGRDDVTKRIFEIIPNFRTTNDQPKNRSPLTSPTAAECATPARGGTSPRIPARSDPPLAMPSTGWSRSPEPQSYASAPSRSVAGLRGASVAAGRHVQPCAEPVCHLARVPRPTAHPAGKSVYATAVSEGYSFANAPALPTSRYFASSSRPKSSINFATRHVQPV